MKNKPLKPITLRPQSIEKIIKRLEQRVKLNKRASVKSPYFKKRKVLRRLRKKLAIKSIRRNR